MKRRDFLKLAGLAGLTVSTPWAASNVFAQDTPVSDYNGPLYLIVHAGGGWDPTSLCDPKGALSDEEENPMNHYLRDEIRSPSGSSPIRWAPFADNDAFFERHYSKMLVINGVNTSTNNHDSGPRHIHSGNLSEGHPAFAAMVAAVHAQNKPLAFITHGGYDITRGVVARTRAGNINAINRIAYPNRIDADNLYHTEAGMDRIVKAQRERIAALKGKTHLPHKHTTISTLELARTSNNELRYLSEFLPDLDSLNTNLGQQAAIAMAAYRAGLCVSANLSTGGFDTHGDHDNRQATALARLTNGVNEIWEQAERDGIADRLVVMVGSDFGRTPRYNDGNGKDHWPITSILLMGQGIPGNRVIGSTTDEHRAIGIDPTTLQPKEDGLIIKPVHIQRALRKFAGISGHSLEAQYPLTGEDINLLG